MSMINTNFASGLNIGNLNFANLTKPSSAGVDSDGDNDGSRVARSGGNAGRFAAAIEQALSQLGVSPTSSAIGAASAGGTTTAVNSSAVGGSSAPRDPTAAMQTFMHDLFSVLRAMGNNSSNIANSAQTSSPTGSSNVAVSGGHGGQHHRGFGAGGIQGNLQSLIQQLSSSTSATGNSADPTIAVLQKDVQSLFGASAGTSNNQTSLVGFLQAISNNLQGNNPGLNVATKV
ncbi:MAG: hypothetical protein HYX63_06310 [Gammaproteobacteria bacterium]|nr:hypothetical protein [Gammaproteobacteria bacterium]